MAQEPGDTQCSDSTAVDVDTFYQCNHTGNVLDILDILHGDVSDQFWPPLDCSAHSSPEYNIHYSYTTYSCWKLITFAWGHSSLKWSCSLALRIFTPQSSHFVLECGHLSRCWTLSEYVPCQSQPALGHFILRLLICNLTALSGYVLEKLISVRSFGQTLLRELITGVIQSLQKRWPHGVCERKASWITHLPWPQPLCLCVPGKGSSAHRDR